MSDLFRNTSLLFPMASAILLTSMVSVADEVRIELRQRATVSTNEIRLGDIATISGEAAQSERLAQLDLSELAPDKEEATISASLVRFRLGLEGWRNDEFLVVGADAVTVRLRKAEPVTDATIENAALDMMADLLSVDAKELRVGLSSSIMSSLPSQIQQDTELRVEVLPPTKSRTGTVALTVKLWRGDRLVTSRPGRFEILQRQQVAVARTSMQRDHIITEKDVQFENRYLPAPVDELDAAQVIGRQVRGNVSVGNLLTLRDLKSQQAAKPEMVVKTRDKLHVTAVSGALRVELRDAEALESGAVGDTILIRNLSSNRKFTGRISRPGEVEIRL